MGKLQKIAEWLTGNQYKPMGIISTDSRITITRIAPYMPKSLINAKKYRRIK